MDPKGAADGAGPVKADVVLAAAGPSEGASGNELFDIDMLS